MPRVDVLVVTALVEEFEAARDVAAEGSAGDPGVATWEPRDEANPPPYLMGDYRLTGDGSLRTALARPTFMGGTETGAAEPHPEQLADLRALLQEVQDRGPVGVELLGRRPGRTRQAGPVLAHLHRRASRRFLRRMPETSFAEWIAAGPGAPAPPARPPRRRLATGHPRELALPAAAAPASAPGRADATGPARRVGGVQG